MSSCPAPHRGFAGPLFLALLTLACRAAAPAPARAPAEPIRITVAATNDLHGWVAPHRDTRADGVVLEEGGLAALGGYVRILREQNRGGVLLLDAGDMFQGTLAANVTEGAVVIEAMNALRYDAAAIGNHEFDYGPVGAVSSTSDPSVDPVGALAARISEAEFPVLAGNVYDARTGRRPAWLKNPGWVLKDVKGVKVALLGLLTPTTPLVTNPVNVAGLRFAPMAPEAQRLAREARAAGAEVVIALTHAGGKCESAKDPRDVSSCDPTQEIFEFLRALPRGTVDLVVAGHTHAVMGHFVHGTPVIESGGMGRTFSLAELSVDPRTRRVDVAATRLSAGIPVCERIDARLGSCDRRALKDAPAVSLIPATFRDRPVVPEPAVALALAPALEKVAELQRRSLGIHNLAPLGRRYESESGLGSFFADLLREMEQADVVLLNSGGLRADLPAGELRYGDLYEVFPFDNAIATVTVNGDELRQLVAAAYGARKGVFQQSGLRLTLGQCPGPRRLRDVRLADGAPLEPSRAYRVVMPDFLARGGDGLAPVVTRLASEQIDFGERRALNFRDAVIAYLRQRNAPIQAPGSGRTQLVADGEQCPPGAAMDLHAHRP